METTVDAIRDVISTRLREKQDSELPQYTVREVGKHCSMDSCWIIVHDKVYNVTEFVSKHPGGVEIILESAGYDATIPFKYKGHSDHAYEMLEKYLIGIIVENERVEKD
ncbi:cytochrome b5-like [Tubulanus polymorphus]|uniref:cytochrome b5-like n=1 Tax=Tubulanus polymorphus TaxID=672921 RepID=UPI003DA385F7